MIAPAIGSLWTHKDSLGETRVVQVTGICDAEVSLRSERGTGFVGYGHFQQMMQPFDGEPPEWADVEAETLQ